MSARARQLLLTYYADDFTGSTAVMEVLALAGVRTQLFLRPPSAEALEHLPGVQAVGLAGVSRSLTSVAMEEELLPAFRALARLPARLFHYKVSSTFDSSPKVGSIGKAIELGQSVFASPLVPVLVGAPALGRYCVFGNLFGRSGPDSAVYRLDRHPTMSRHPVTPMMESDLALHLASQTSRRIALLDFLKLAGPNGTAEKGLAQLQASGAEVIILDVLGDESLPVLGRLLSNPENRFIVGSSGVEDALTAYWRQSGLLPSAPPRQTVRPVEQVLAISGSCSPVSAQQIRCALAGGFAEVRLDPAEWAAPRSVAAGSALSKTIELLAAGRSVVVHSACGPDDPRIAQARELLSVTDNGHARDQVLGGALARFLRAAVDAGVRRVAIAGGDTSGYVARALKIEALSFLGPLGPGSPLCRVHASSAVRGLDGLEVTFKGGQVGEPDFFMRVKHGA